MYLVEFPNRCFPCLSSSGIFSGPPTGSAGVMKPRNPLPSPEGLEIEVMVPFLRSFYLTWKLLTKDYMIWSQTVPRGRSFKGWSPEEPGKSPLMKRSHFPIHFFFVDNLCSYSIPLFHQTIETGAGVFCVTDAPEITAPSLSFRIR